MLCMPLYGFVQGSYKFSSPPPSNNGTAMAARIGAAKGLGTRNLFSIRAEVNSKLHHASSAIPGC